MTEITYYNRYTKKNETEKVYGGTLVNTAYLNPKRAGFIDKTLALPWVSRLYGGLQSSFLSRGKIRPFIKNFQINMDEYMPGPFKSFNDFFTRQFKPEARHFVDTPALMPAFCEGRYLGFKNVSDSLKFPIKGVGVNVNGLLRISQWSQKFIGGPALICRLCPVDYHRFHFPDDGKLVNSYQIHGKLHSVNPMALKNKEDVFLVNERTVSVLNTKNFGWLAYVEVGAMMVGKIVQSFKGENFTRGQEKGYFLFGGSTVVVIGEAGAWVPDQDILQNTSFGIETFVKLGDTVAQKP
ncbi:MAG: phosphatidylserine decarboxylase [Oligoflexia bacterium]|nr:phosphatidylserine decarboxylase [Oligoflexia bacterium]